MSALLELDGVCAGYGQLQVLFGVTVTVAENEIVALMGSNGAGKTTTLKATVGLLPKTAGAVRFAGQDVTRARPEALVRRGLCLVPEGRGMLRDLTVEDNLRLGATALADRAGTPAALARAYDTFPILADRRTQRAGTLSGGQQQMLALARALMSSPRLLAVDEASLGLSPVMTETAFGLLRDVNRRAGVAVLLVEQNALALDLAHRAYVLEKGEIAGTAEGEDVARMQGRLREAYLGVDG